MSRSADKQARAEAMLGELAELSLMVARELAVRVRESEDAGETVALAGAFQKMSRVVRLTLALDAKLERDAARDWGAETEAARSQAEAEARAAKALEPADPADVRKDRVRSLMNRLLWNESEGEEEEYEILVEDLNARLDEAARHPDFDTAPIEALTKRLIADMGLSGRFTLSLGEKPAKEAPERALAPADTG